MSKKLGKLWILALTVALPATFGGGPAAAAGACVNVKPPVGPSYVDCAGGNALNILPAGQDGVENAFQAAGGQPPPHAGDQEPLYANLIKEAPNVRPGDVAKLFKAANLGIPANDVGRVYSPRAGVVIVRDKSFDVPHIFGATRADTEFGAGYAAAEDRLFFMDALRHVGRSTAASFLGAAPAVVALDCSVAQVAGYDEAELQQQIDNLPKKYTTPFGNGNTEGQQVVADGTAYVDGINAYVQAALANPALMPAEYPALQVLPALWKPTDVIAVATLVQAIFATGGGGEVDSALFNRSLVQTYGGSKGNAIWADFRSRNDPEAPTTLQQAFPYGDLPATIDPASLAMPVAPVKSDNCRVNGAPPGGRPGKFSVAGVTLDFSSLLAAFQNHHMSNWILIEGKYTAGGHPIAVMGPQTGYYEPEILHEEDLHGPGIEARGAAFPGTDIYVELGRGEDYAWSATSAGSDQIDLRAERLCDPTGAPPSPSDTAYLFNGKCTPMYERVDTEVAKPTAAAPNPAVITMKIERTVHGPVLGRTLAIDPATGAQVPIAVSIQRATWFDELGSAPAFLEWNDPDHIRSADDFLAAAAKETGTFNWAYADSRNIAYYSSGLLPVRPANVNPDFPVWGTGQWEWQGFLRADGSSQDPHPHSIDPPSGFLASWNNKPAPAWSAADDNYAYGPVYRVKSLSDRMSALVKRGHVIPADMVNAMGDAATVDLDGSQLVAQVEAVLAGTALTAQQQTALGLLSTCSSRDAFGGSHRRALLDANAYDDGAAIAIMDALYPRLAHAVFDPWLSQSQFAQLEGLLALNNPPGPVGSAYDGGWEGYLQRALRQAVTPAIASPYSQPYCGSGSLAACQSALRGALQATLDALTAAYQNGDPNSWSCARSNSGAGRCDPGNDDIQFSAVGVMTVPNMPWQNRPTFQQVVQFPASR